MEEPAPALSIVIPTHREATNLQELLPQLSASSGCECIIADSEGDVASRELAQQYGALFLHCPQVGRSRQMNYGAARARAPVLFFLHADCRPPARFAEAITTAVRGGCYAGSFRLRFDWDHWFLRLNTWFTRFRHPYFRFGDQGLYIRRDLFDQLGGYREDMLLLEDQELTQRIARRKKLCILPHSMLTSARKYRKNGAFYLQWVFYNIWWRYHRGWSQERLAAYYRRKIKTAH